MSTSDTPRVGAFDASMSNQYDLAREAGWPSHDFCNFADFARQLERELAWVTQNFDSMNIKFSRNLDELTALREQVRALEEDKLDLDWLEQQTMRPEEWVELCDKWRWDGKRYPQGLRFAIRAARPASGGEAAT